LSGSLRQDTLFGREVVALQEPTGFGSRVTVATATGTSDAAVAAFAAYIDGFAAERPALREVLDLPVPLDPEELVVAHAADADRLRIAVADYRDLRRRIDELLGV
jgi:hypothetical protein